MLFTTGGRSGSSDDSKDEDDGRSLATPPMMLMTPTGLDETPALSPTTPVPKFTTVEYYSLWATDVDNGEQGLSRSLDMPATTSGDNNSNDNGARLLFLPLPKL